MLNTIELQTGTNGALHHLNIAASSISNARKHLKLNGASDTDLQQLGRLEGEVIGLFLRLAAPAELVVAPTPKDVEKPKTFAVGTSYSCRSACDYDTIYTWTVIKRTAKQVTLAERGGREKEIRRGIYLDDDGVEWCRPHGVYSMSPCISADRPDASEITE